MSYRFENGWALDFSNSFLALITCKETANFAPSLSRLILDCFPEDTNWVRKGMLCLSLKSIFRSTDSVDFRGISVTSVIERAFERAVYNIFNRRDMESRLGANQFPYRTGGRCTDAVVKMQHDISGALDNPRNKALGLFTTDYSKALDNVNHHILAKKQKNKPNEPTYG